jgi:leucyl aminopeptidase
MLQCFKSDRTDAIRIIPVTTAILPTWLERHPETHAWLSGVGFRAEPGSFAFVPHGGGRPFVVAAPIEGPPVYAFAGLPTTLPEETYALDLAQDHGSPTDAAIGWALGAYAFSAYKKPHRAPAKLAWPDNADRDEVERIVRAVFLARDMINTPAQDMGPEQLADAARGVADRHAASLRVIVGDELLAQNYPTVHAVGRASVRPPRLIDMRWGDEGAPKVTLIGKGVCFDTGGLDLKSRDAMLEMKKDMGGAAIVLALADALMAARTPIRLRVLIPAVENSVSGNALRPRDIVRTRSGKTVEIGNTDAEGRLILCDALAEADAERPDLLVDCATLTGAARVALGPELQALYCDDDATAAGLLDAGTATGDPFWRMPLWRPYRRELQSTCADLSNVARNSFAGSIIAALYLAEFVSTPRWAHIDLYAANPSSRPGRPEGGEATGMRALYTYIRRQYANREASAQR